MKNNDRLEALTILSTLLRTKSSLSQLMPATADLSPMTKELCFGFCRHYFRLEAIAHVLMDKKPKDTEVFVAVLMGFYQLQYMKQPDYAVVQETVALLGAIKKIWAKGLVNAVLRGFCRQREVILADLMKNPLFIHGQPEWFLKQITKDWPGDWQSIAAENDKHPPMTLRVNQSKISRGEYLLRLHDAKIEAEPHCVATEGIVLKTPCNVHELPGFSEGLVSVQDAAAQLAASLLSLKPGDRVLDACCAPGGKTCHILESEKALSLCVALDVDEKRLKRVEANFQRLDLQAQLLVGDALNPAAWWDGLLFDKILVDAPCSATGVIRRHSDIKLLRTAEEVCAVAVIQKDMLRALWPLLAPGGLMLYATCSVLSLENEQQIAGFLADTPNAKLVQSPWDWGRATGFGQQILPGEQGMDGFFYCLLEKC